MPEFKAGDKVRYKMREGAEVRTNGALDMVLLYYGTEHVIYEWSNPDRPNSSGEVHMRRIDFDEQCELVPDDSLFEQGVSYKHRSNPTAISGVYRCVFADDQLAVLAQGRTRLIRRQGLARIWERVA